jgi:NADPH:quinone reductase-like Zn-dependent oxidoreductase
MTNQALTLPAYGGPEVLTWAEIPLPTLRAGQVLVQVTAAGVNGLDWKVRDGLVRDAFPLTLPAVLGIELAGIVAQVAPGNSRLKVGDRVMGPLAGLGAYATFVAVDELKLAAIPEPLRDIDAAALPVAALTAWQSLRAAGELQPGQRVLIHGAAGGVGGFAVQFAKAAGATVLTTASAMSREHLIRLGADEVIDRHAQRFEDHAVEVDLVLDLVGGEMLDRSWPLLMPDGALVSTAAPDVVARTPRGRRGLWFAMQPDAAQLRVIADAVAAGSIRSTIAEITDVAGLGAAIERNKRGHSPGKIVVDFAR